MHLVLFEDSLVSSFFPIALNRPIFFLSCGMMTLAEKWISFFPPFSFSSSVSSKVFSKDPYYGSYPDQSSDQNSDQNSLQQQGLDSKSRIFFLMRKELRPLYRVENEKAIFFENDESNYRNSDTKKNQRCPEVLWEDELPFWERFSSELLKEDFLCISGRVLFSEDFSISKNSFFEEDEQVLAFRTKGEKLQELSSEDFLNDKLGEKVRKWGLKKVQQSNIRVFRYLFELVLENERELNRDFQRKIQSLEQNNWQKLSRLEDSSVHCMNLELYSHSNSRVSGITVSGELYIDEEARVEPYSVLRGPCYIGKGVVLRGSQVLAEPNRPVWIDDFAQIQPYSVIRGPCYIGKGAWVHSAKIHASSAFESVKLGGEIEHSIVLPYSNKVHEGFLGNSYLGSFVNFGALASTSNLRNNYSSIRVSLKGKNIDSGSIKLGSFIGDHSKIGMASVLNTGSNIGLGNNLYSSGAMYPKEIPSFVWGTQPYFQEHDFARFIQTTEKVLKRRKKTLRKEELDFLRSLFESQKEEREDFFSAFL